MSFFFVLCFNLSCQDERQHYPRKHSLGFEEPGNHRKVNLSFIFIYKNAIGHYPESCVFFFKVFYLFQLTF